MLTLQHMCVKPLGSCMSSALHVTLLLPSLSGGFLCSAAVVVGAVNVAAINGELWSVVSVVRIILLEVCLHASDFCTAIFLLSGSSLGLLALLLQEIAPLLICVGPWVVALRDPVKLCISNGFVQLPL